ncbi:sugar transferase [Agromyces sp. SYSU T00194]|uniref:sugar transferase n=1 Tax=Agromyces chitinivorans TaxID=3158560 RepID=UPI00339ABA7F
MTTTNQRSRAASRLERWQRDYAARLFATDLVVIVVAVFGSQLLRFGENAAAQRVAEQEISYTLVSILLIVVWMVSLDLFSTRDHTVIGAGAAEYRRLVDATIRVFGVLAIVAYLLQSQLGRGYVLIALPGGVLLLIASRWCWRQWLVRQRARGAYSRRVLLVGERAKSVHVAEQMGRAPTGGFRIVGAVTDHGSVDQDLVRGVPVLGDFPRVLEALEEADADTVIYAGSDLVRPDQLRELGWDLEEREVSLVMAPALVDVAGPRIHATPVAGLPLIHVDYPRFIGRKYATKRVFDIAVSSVALLVLSPVFLVIALLVRRDSAGPAFFAQERVGLNGGTFHMLKFRSMVVDAEGQLPGLLDKSDGNDVLFKLRADPRVTRVGAVLRRYSLDELPQLVNVLRGEMSLVGPRPPLPREVERYGRAAERRLLVRPGITGLWQVSGRSDLSWSDSLRLDLFYVENWSLTGDIIVLMRTVRAVASSRGAY